jgi:tubby-related protein 1
MSLKSIVRELREIKDGMGGSMSRRGGGGSGGGGEGKHWHRRTRSHVVVAPADKKELILIQSLLPSINQDRWENLPPELLLDIIRRIEESETSWPARAVVVACASVCRSWRAITSEIVNTPEQCGKLTFPISLKQVMISSFALFF